MLLLCLGVNRESSEFLLFRGRGVAQLAMLSSPISGFVFRSVGTAWSNRSVHVPGWSAFLFFRDFVLFVGRHKTAVSRFLKRSSVSSNVNKGSCGA